MHIFYVPQTKGDKCILPENEAKHAIQVLRLKRNSEVILIDGKGGYYHGYLESVNSLKDCQVRIIEKKENFGKREKSLHIAISPTKNISRFEWFIEKAVEIGIEEITPLITSRSERTKINIERMQKVILSAAKQSHKAFFPKLNPLIKYADFLKNHSVASKKYIAHCDFGRKRVPVTELNLNLDDTIVLIGPEGDYTKEEIEKAAANQFTELGLGRSRLRTETAAIVVCTLFSY